MIRLVTNAGFAIVLATGLATAASAATLSDVSGPVMVDQGKGFVKVSAGADVQPGSRVLVAKGGKAVLAYADGCSKALGAGSITSVVEQGACQQATQVAGQSSQQQQNISPWLLGGAGLAGGTLIGYAIGQGSSNSDNTVYVPISR